MNETQKRRPSFSKVIKIYMYPVFDNFFNENKFSSNKRQKFFYTFILFLLLHSSVSAYTTQKRAFAGRKFKSSHTHRHRHHHHPYIQQTKDVELWWIYYRSVIFRTRRKIWQLGVSEWVSEKERLWVGVERAREWER